MNNSASNSLRRLKHATRALLTEALATTSLETSLRARGLAFGRRGKYIDKLPTRETWLCLYQPEPGRTAYLYEYDIPIDNQVYAEKVAPELTQHFGRPARECYIHSVDGESFANCDRAHPPWRCYRLRLSGVRLGQRLGPYAADDIVAPNQATLPLQGRWRNNVRDVRDLIDFLALPSEARLTASMRQLVAVAHQDVWRSGPAAVQALMVQRWGHDQLARHGITAQAIRQAYDLYGDRMQADDSSEEGGGGGGGGNGEAADAAAAERRAARRRQRRAVAVGDAADAASSEAEGGLGTFDWGAATAVEDLKRPSGGAAGVHGLSGRDGGGGRVS